MNKTLLLSLWCVALLFVAFPLHAQTGCTDSPENPTVVLALVGSAGGLFSMARTRWKARRSSAALEQGITGLGPSRSRSLRPGLGCLSSAEMPIAAFALARFRPTLDTLGTDHAPKFLLFSSTLAVSIAAAACLACPALRLWRFGDVTTGHSHSTGNNYPGVTFGGKAMAGKQPLIGASVQVYAAGTAATAQAAPHS